MSLSLTGNRSTVGSQTLVAAKQNQSEARGFYLVCLARGLVGGGGEGVGEKVFNRWAKTMGWPNYLFPFLSHRHLLPLAQLNVRVLLPHPPRHIFIASSFLISCENYLL
jgi:hypothetical protein